MLQPDHPTSARPLPPYSYVPGHALPHPVNDPEGHYFGAPHPQLNIPALPDDPRSRRHVLALFLAANSPWLYALDLFNAGYYWEAHEAWEQFWNALGRTTPEARCVQGLIHLAAAAVKIREGKPAGVSSHTRRARELLGDTAASGVFDVSACASALGMTRESIAAVVAELDSYRPACWHTSRTPVVRVLASKLRCH